VPPSQKCSVFEFCKHALDDRLQLWQVGGGGFPQDFVVDAMIFMPQRVADADDVGPGRVGITRSQFFRKRPRRLGNNLDCALGNAAKAVALPVGLEVQAGQLLRKAFDSSRM
jgi:hypothetical protein